MTLEEFRINHSLLIEHYQYIEEHLEGIYAAISGKTLLEGLIDTEKSSLPSIVKGIKAFEKNKSIRIFSNSEYDKLQYIFRRRNFWCHNCYFDLVFDRKTHGLKKDKDIQQLMADLAEAELWREKLYNKKMSLLANKKEKCT